MSDARKAPDEPEEDDIRAFDDLEKGFHHVLQQLIDDHSFDRFREQYEALNAGLIKSHAENQSLIAKCRQLNNTMLSNASKISSLLSLSQSDQRTIAGLRHEFEKAWRLVEVFGEKDASSAEAIDAMKSEVQDLTRLIQQGGTQFATQETSLQDVTDSIVLLRKEIALQSKQFDSLRTHLATTRSGLDEAQKQLSALSFQCKSLTETIEAQRQTANACAAETGEVAAAIFAANYSIRQLRAHADETATAIANKMESARALRFAYADNLQELRATEADVACARSQLAATQSRLTRLVKKSERSRNHLMKRQAALQERDSSLADFASKLAAILTERAGREAELQLTQNARAEVEAEASKCRRLLSDFATEKLRLAADWHCQSLESRAEHREIDHRLTKVRELRSQVGAERVEMRAADSGKATAANEILAAKGEIQTVREKIIRLEHETGEYEGRSLCAMNNCLQIAGEVRIREEEIDSHVRALGCLHDRQKYQDARIEAVQTERDLACRMFQAALHENAELEHENAISASEVRRLKCEVREKDSLCIATHVQQQKTVRQIRELSQTANEFKTKFKEAGDAETEIRNKISRAMYLVNEADLEARKHGHALSIVSESSRALDKEIVSKTREFDVLSEKAALLGSLIEREHSSFDRLNQDVQSKIAELNREVEHQKELLHAKRYARGLVLERLRVEKSLVVEQSKAKGLEEELEKPMRVHRWRFLDSVNPQLAELIRMNISLRDKLMGLIGRVDRLHLVKNNLVQELVVQERHLQLGYGGCLEDERAHLVEVLKDKNRLLKQLQTQASEQGQTVAGTRDRVQSVRVMVREGKSQLQEVRAKTAIGRRTKPAPESRFATPRKETKFVGGGFAVAAKMPPQERPPTSPTLVVPTNSPKKSPQTPQPAKIAPPGWNAARGSLSPLMTRRGNF
jgi:chromosome segregation ATPase